MRLMVNEVWRSLEWASDIYGIMYGCVQKESAKRPQDTTAQYSDGVFQHEERIGLSHAHVWVTSKSYQPLLLS